MNYTFALPFQQQFPLPKNIIYYITKNPSNSEVYQKLIQTCKYFFSNNPILVVKNIFDEGGQHWFTNESYKIFDVRYMSIEEKPSIFAFETEKCQYQLWVIKAIQENNYTFSNLLFPNLLTKLYRCKLSKLQLRNEILTYNEFLKLVSSKTIEILFLKKVIIKYENGQLVTLEKIMEYLPKIRQFEIMDGDISAIAPIETFQKLLQFPIFQHLKNFKLGLLPKSFNLQIFSEFTKKQARTKFELYYFSLLSKEDFQDIGAEYSRYESAFKNTRIAYPFIFYLM